jgi:penicillin amidase
MIVRIFLLMIIFTYLSGFNPVISETQVTETTLNITGLKDTVKVYIDDYGVPYIIAKNEQDLMFAHGYMQAKDRLFQLDGIRRVPQGRISEIIGRDYLGMDLEFRKLGFGRLAEEQLKVLNPETLSALESYSNGINAYLAECEFLPMEFLILGYKPEPWKPYDSLCVIDLVCWWLSTGSVQEEVYSELVKEFGKDNAERIFPGIPKRDFLDESLEDENAVKDCSDLCITGTDISLSKPAVKESLPNGTNCWVVSGKKTASGKPILANDTHLNLFSPSIWYETGLFCPEWSSVGVVFPGLPFHQIGTNGRIAWGAANFPADSQDYYIEKVNPQNKNQYWYDGKWNDYLISDEVIKVKDSNSLEYSCLKSVHGPVIDALGDQNYALAWSGFEPSDHLIAFKEAVKSKNVDDFTLAISKFRAAPQHFFAFDTDGNIIHLQPGLIPIRQGFNGDLPLDGSDPEFDWSGFYSFYEIPILKNPDSGILNNSNNFPPQDYGLDLGTCFPMSARYVRTFDLLSSRNDFTMDDMAHMQMDVLNPVAEKILPLMLKQVEDLPGNVIPQYQNDLEILKKWDYRETSESIAATIYNEWWIEFPKYLFNKKLGLYAENYRDWQDQCSITMIDILENGEKSDNFQWFNLGNSVNLTALCGISFENAMRNLEKCYGFDRENWKWGMVHKAVFKHPSGVELPILGLGQKYGVGGSRYTLNVTHYYPSMGYDADFGASYRIVASIDEKNRIVAQSILPPGNSAFLKSPHFNDQIGMWCEGKLKKLYVYPDEVKKLKTCLVLKSD